MVWVALRSTPDGDELVTAHLAEHKKVRNVRRDPRVAVTIVTPGDVGKTLRPYLSIDGTAWIEEGGAPELLKLCRRSCWTRTCSRRRMRRPDS